MSLKEILLIGLRNKGWACFLKEEMSRMFLKGGTCVARFGWREGNDWSEDGSCPREHKGSDE